MVFHIFMRFYFQKIITKCFRKHLSVFGMEALFAIWRPVGIEMTSLLAVFLASLLDLKDRLCYISRLGPGEPSAD